MTSQMALLAGLLLFGVTAMSYEQPDYTVVYKDGNVEYRQYDPYLVSETIINQSEGYKDAGNEGFRRLFRYITGANEGQSKIAMTSPVQQGASDEKSSEKIAMTTPVHQGAAAEGWSVAFMLPAEYTLETAPQPTDPRVRVREVPGRLMAVLRFSGRWTERNFMKKQAALSEELTAQNVNIVGEMESAYYNAPFSLPFLRRNEVMVEVNRLPAAANGPAPSTEEADDRLAAQRVAAY